MNNNVKKWFLISTYIVFSVTVFAQSPQSFQYQAVVRDAGGNAVVSQPVIFRLSIISGSLPGTVVYVETHNSVTNQFGVATLSVGNGIPLSGTFAGIIWSSAIQSLKVEADLGSGYINMGTTQLLSVPYALYSENAGNAGDSVWSKSGNNIFNNNTGNVGVGTNSPTRKMVIQGSNAVPDSVPIFEIRNKSGQQVMVIYNDSVQFYITDANSPSNRGGFAVSGRSNAKGVTNDYLKVRPDSTRIYTGDSLTGFGVRNIGVSSKTSYMQLTPKNYFIGHESGRNNLGGNYNSFIGYQSGFNNLNGNKNYFFGYRAGYNNIDGENNIFIGDSTGLLNNDGRFNIFVGNMCGINNNSNYNLFMGYNAGFSNTTGQSNIFMGHSAGYSNVGGLNNVFIGFMSGYANTGDVLNGINNVFIGTYSGSDNTSGKSNVFIGEESGKWTTTGTGNLYIGKSAYGTAAGNYNVSLGYNARAYGSNTVSVGSMAGYNSTGSNCVFLGNMAGYAISTNNILMIENTWPTSAPLVYGDFANDRICFHRSGTTYPLQVGNTSTNGNGAYVTGGGVWTPGSSRTFKDRYTDLDGQYVLDKIENMELKGWFYKGTQEYHIGPFAEDFYEAFSVGVLDIKEDLGKYLSPTDVSGVGMVAIQALIKKNKELEKTIMNLQALIKEILSEYSDLKAEIEKK